MVILFVIGVVNLTPKKMSEPNLKVLNGEVCPYCGGVPTFVDSDSVYTRSYGMLWVCEPCEAWVGVHNGTDKPLGRLADKDLREAKIEAHKYFDCLWRKAMRTRGWRKSKARNTAYDWLANQIGKPREYTHIGMFDEAECFRVVAACKEFYEPNL